MRISLGALGLAALVACSVPEHTFKHPIDAAPVDAPPDALPSMLSWTPAGDTALGDVIIGQTSADATITISNDGGSTSGALAVGFDDTMLGFAISNDGCTSMALPPHQTCTFTVHFSPTAAGAATTMLHAHDGSTDLARMVSGNGLTRGQIDITDTSYDFQTLAVDAPPAKKVFTVRNLGQATAGIPMPTTSSGDPSYAVDSTTCTVPLAQNDTCTVTVAFDPSTVGQKAGAFTVTATPGGQDVATLSGTGIAHVTVTPNGNGTGTVVSSQPGINCGATCSADFSSTPITLTAAPDVGSQFTGWGVDCAGTGTCTLDLTGAKTAIATFTLQRFALIVTPAGNGTGTVTSNVGAINCGATCSDTYDYNTMVTLTAATPSGTTFTGWSGDCSGTGACTVTMTQARNVTATFTLQKEALTITPAGTGTGAVTSNVGAINCGTACTDNYDYGTMVVLTAAPSIGATLSSWSGCTTSSGNTCNVTMTAAKNVTATFDLVPYALTVTPPSNGAVTSSDGFITCGATCSRSYTYNAAVTLNAAPVLGYHFDHWSGGPCDLSTSPMCAFAMPAAATTTAAIFTIDSEALTVTVNGTGTGTVTSNPSGIGPCPGAGCTAGFPYNTLVTLTAAPSGNSSVTWSGCVPGANNTCTVTMTAAASVTVTFTASPQTLTVTTAGNGTGGVSSNPAGIACPGTCSAAFTYNTMVTLTATATGVSTFAGWTGACTGTGPCLVTMSQAQSVTATFTAADQVLTLMSAGNGGGTVSVSPPPKSQSGNQYTYAYNAAVTITASPNATTSTFTGWSGACSGTGTSCTVTMNQAQNVTATFTLIKKRLTVTTTSPNGGSGDVTPNPAGTSCGTLCWDYDYGTTVVLTAGSNVGSSFTSWSTCAGSGTCTVNMTADTSETATFTLQTFALGVAKSGNGSGTVTSNVGAINCGATCSDTYNYNTPVTLTATPATGTTFTGWSGDCSGQGTCVVSMTQVRNVTATFTLQTKGLTVTLAGTGSGLVTSDVGAINCGVTCSDTYNYNTTVTLTAAPSTGSTLASWTGCTSSTATTCTVSMTAAKNVTATFNLVLYGLTITPPSHGSVASTDGNISCGSTCSKSYNYQSPVTLTASAATGYHFDHWSGGPCDLSTSATCAFNMPAAATTTAAIFTIDSELLTVTVDGTGTGTVASAPAAIACPGANCSASFNYNTFVTLTATPGGGSSVSWTGCTPGAGNTCTLTMTAAASVTATFSAGPQTLTVATSGNGTGSVSSVPAGIACPGVCSSTYAFNTSVTLTAAASGVSTFAGWTGDCTGTGTCTVAMNQAHNVTATFSAGDQILTIGQAGTGGGTINVLPAPKSQSGNQYTYAYNTAVTITESPGSSSTFSGWSGACTGTGTSCTITMDQAQSVTASFALITKQLTIALSSPNGGTGSVIPAPVGASCGTRCWTYDYGTVVTLTATAASGSSFNGWSTCGGTGTCSVTMNGDVSETATFVTNYTLTVTDAGDGTGSVTGAPGGVNGSISCTSGSSTGCSVDYAGVTPATSVTLTASPAGGSQFTGWTGACAGTQLTCSVAMSAARSVTATFTKIYNLTAQTSGSGSITQTATPASVGSCGANCTQYLSATSVSLTATPQAGYYFTGWTGDCASQGATCALTMSANHATTANFGQLDQLTVTLSGSGNVSSTDGFIDCGATCQHSYTPSSPVTLSAAPAAGSVFAGWSGGGCSGTGNCGLTMNAATTVTASFDYDVSYGVSGSGSVGITAGGLACTPASGFSSCSAFPASSAVTLTASPSTGYQFSSWSGACSGQGATCSLSATQAYSTKANFTPISYTLSLNITGGGSVTVNGTAYSASQSLSFAYGTAMTLTASAASGSVFTGWSGGTCSGSTTCTFTMSAATTVNASFYYDVSYDVAGGGSGSVSITAGGVACTPAAGYANCKAFAPNASVSLTASPNTGSSFSSWSGSCASQGASCTVTMNQAYSTKANFSLNSYQVTLSISGSGTVTINGAGYTSSQTLSYPYGTALNISESPGSGYAFNGWSGSCGGNGSTCAFTVTGNASLGATFSPTYTLSTNNSTHGTTTGPGINCGTGGSTCAAAEIQGQSVVLSANSNSDACVISGGEPGNYEPSGCTCTSTPTGQVSCSWDAFQQACTVTAAAPTTVTVTMKYSCL